MNWDKKKCFYKKKKKNKEKKEIAITTATHKLKRLSYLNLYYESQKLLKTNLKSKTCHKIKTKYVYMCNIKYIYGPISKCIHICIQMQI